MTIIRVQNHSGYPLYFGDITINRGINDINRLDWETFLEGAKSSSTDLVDICLRTGQLKVLDEKPLPLSLNDLSLDEAKKAIGACKDSAILKRWYLDLQPENFKPRLLIVERAAYGFPLRFTEGELQSFHYQDQFRSLSDPDQEIIDQKNDEFKQAFRNEIARQEKHYELQKEYLQRIKEIG